MKKLISVLVLAALAAGCAQKVKETEKFRTVSGILTYSTFHEKGDYHSMELQTEDGNTWTVKGFICPLFTKCKVTFNTKGTENLKDDEIVKIVTYTEFRT